MNETYQVSFVSRSLGLSIRSGLLEKKRERLVIFPKKKKTKKTNETYQVSFVSRSLGLSIRSGLLERRGNG
jgi:hypothetical protein